MAKHDKSTTVNVVKTHGPAGFAAFTAFIGAFVYFAQHAHDFVGYVDAFVDAVVWPGILVYHVLLTLHV